MDSSPLCSFSFCVRERNAAGGVPLQRTVPVHRRNRVCAGCGLPLCDAGFVGRGGGVCVATGTASAVDIVVSNTATGNLTVHSGPVNATLPLAKSAIVSFQNGSDFSVHVMGLQAPVLRVGALPCDAVISDVDVPQYGMANITVDGPFLGSSDDVVVNLYVSNASNPQFDHITKTGQLTKPIQIEGQHQCDDLVVRASTTVHINGTAAQECSKSAPHVFSWRFPPAQPDILTVDVKNGPGEPVQLGLLMRPGVVLGSCDNVTYTLRFSLNTATYELPDIPLNETQGELTELTWAVNVTVPEDREVILTLEAWAVEKANFTIGPLTMAALRQWSSSTSTTTAPATTNGPVSGTTAGIIIACAVAAALCAVAVLVVRHKRRSNYSPL
eukprot:m.194063 g.194063  ORF g.194063 m.194063 type:complete len:385 (-) comp21775_c0_seq7:40-1194(-)